MAFEHIQEKIKNLPPAAKFGLVAVTAIIVYLIIKGRLKKSANALDSSGSFVEVQGATLGSGGGGGSGGGVAQAGGSGSTGTGSTTDSGNRPVDPISTHKPKPPFIPPVSTPLPPIQQRSSETPLVGVPSGLQTGNIPLSQLYAGWNVPGGFYRPNGLVPSQPSGGAREAFSYGNPVQYPNAWRYQGGNQQDTVPRYGNMVRSG